MDSTGGLAYLDLVAFSESMGLMGSNNAIPAKGAQRRRICQVMTYQIFLKREWDLFFPIADFR